ncbi:protein Bouncer-like [Gadus macrocephalus]|uniref:protein Bouncer-like n=1 Tax=Gadus macrocephalus TaxID=80720 RepID=UPI0028CB7980|nr:protein Bouncer-like [Gadus macrocephalus]
MESQRKQSRLGWYLASLLLVPLLVLPGLCLDTLLCNYCPLQHKGQSCPDVTTTTTTRCLADERCASSWGRFGSLHVLSAQGCMTDVLCGTHEFLRYRGIRYNVSHACCCEDRCNLAPRPESALSALLGLIAHKLEGINFGNLTRNVIAEVPSDSCINYTSSRGQTRGDVFDTLS